MLLTLESAPAKLPVTIDDVRQQLRIDGDDETAAMDRLLRAATAAVDGRGALGRPMITQSWAQWCYNPTEVRVKMVPFQSLTSVQYYDSAGTLQTDTLSNYEAVGAGDRVWIRPKDGFEWPEQEDRPDALKITYVAGYGDNPSDVPESVRQAVLLLVTHMFEERMPVTRGSSEIPWMVNDLLNLERVTWYA